MYLSRFLGAPVDTGPAPAEGHEYDTLVGARASLPSLPPPTHTDQLFFEGLRQKSDLWGAFCTIVGAFGIFSGYFFESGSYLRHGWSAARPGATRTLARTHAVWFACNRRPGPPPLARRRSTLCHCLIPPTGCIVMIAVKLPPPSLAQAPPCASSDAGA